MDYDQTMTAARHTAAEQQDTALAATIVMAIPELERDYRLAEGALSERLIRDVKAAMQKAAPEPWEVADTNYSVLLRSPQWRLTRGLGNGDAWLEINEISADDLNRILGRFRPRGASARSHSCNATGCPRRGYRSGRPRF